MQKLVVDSSVSIKWVNSIDEERVEQAEKIILDVRLGKMELLAPELSKYEVCNVLLVRKRLSIDQMKKALEFFYRLPITFYKDDLELAEIASSFVVNFGITYYDASFAALAKKEGATLVTDNPKHQAKIKGVKVVPLSEYT
ncbi:type II toxin-antitoxin system VapC family toxin [Candidatus Roizmanbacteria bacterium]|nr:type II toxin-antitoxin system VapC family toxin [Candidatus Roizmanbacteria bacterium]